MDIKELENRIEEYIGHDYDCALFDETNNQCDCGTFKTVRQIMSSVKSYMAEVIGERDLEIQAVKNAFTVKGVNPEYHDKIKRQLAVEWPTLYYALESLTYSAGLSQPVTKENKEESTDRKCPNCKSSNFYDKDGFLWECTDCGHIWNDDDEQPATKTRKKSYPFITAKGTGEEDEV